jgi:ABC-type cobalamin/Fe3+-siderophores transport system ATPase subunit
MTGDTMAQYDDLLADLADLRKRTSRFRRVALHLHSPESDDWNKTGDRRLNERTEFLAPSGEARFIAVLKPHFDLVVITDHMKCSYASRVSKATVADEGFRVLPGMEVNFRPEAAMTTMRLHLLAVLPEDGSPEQFSRLFANVKDIPDDADRNGQEEVKGVALAAWIRAIHDAEGICVAAHVDNPQGARYHFRQTGRDILKLFAVDGCEKNQQEQDISNAVKDFLFGVGFDAVEVAKASNERHYRWFSESANRDVSIPVTMKLDAHCIEDFDCEDRVTWIKMTTLSLRGLRDALMFPETRVSFKTDLPTPPSPRLLGVEIIGDTNSFFERVRVAFAENLNCLIGPRGSGKSTVVEALRYVFGYNRTLNELDTTNKLSGRIRGMQVANLTGCLPRVVYQTQAKDTRVLEATFDPNEDYATKVYTADGEPLNVPDLEACGEYPLRLFGWSEIETLGRDAARQRDLLDRLIPELPAAKHERDELRARLRSNRAEVDQVVSELKTFYTRQNGLIRRFVEHKTVFEKLNTDAVKKHFAALDLAQAKQRVLELLSLNVARLAARLKELDAVTLREGLDEVLTVAEQDLRDWWLTDELSSLRVVDAETDVQKQQAAAAEILKSFSALLDQHITGTKQAVEEIQARIRAAFADDSSMQKIADLRANAEKRLRDVSSLRDEYLKSWKRLQDTLAARQGTADALVACHERIAGIRSLHNVKIEEGLNRYFADRLKISLRFDPGGDTQRFGEALARLKVASSVAAQYQRRRIAETLAAHFNPITLVRALLNGDLGQVAGKHPVGDPTNQITTAEAQKAMDAWRPWGRDELAEVDWLADEGGPLRGLMELQEVEWDDHESILLNDRPVGELSPGQRSSAMLPLIALAEPTPLVIDQPEDNLDNRLVGHVLTDILASLKEKRQIIVCTHNPNIVVSGDAEQVVVLDAISDRKGEVLRHGSIDNQDIVQSVIDIMEGGADAFRARQQRYGF